MAGQSLFSGGTCYILVSYHQGKTGESRTGVDDEDYCLNLLRVNIVLPRIEFFQKINRIPETDAAEREFCFVFFCRISALSHQLIIL